MKTLSLTSDNPHCRQTLALLFLPAIVSAATRTVTTLVDGPLGSLRNHISASAPGDAITFAVLGVISLTNELAISRDLIIAGPGANVLMISGGGAHRVFNVGSNAQVVMAGIAIVNGHVAGTDGMNGLDGSPGLPPPFPSPPVYPTPGGDGQGAQGGGIWNRAALTLSNCLIRGWNVARTAGQIQEGMRRQLPRTESGLVACWHLDENNGILAFDATGSGGNTGVLQNGPAWVASTILPFAPNAATVAATGVAGTNATLNGSASPNGAPSMGYFEWGTTANLGNVTPAQSLDSGAAPVAWSRPLSGLTPGALYYYRAVATNSHGASLGEVLSLR